MPALTEDQQHMIYLMIEEMYKEFCKDTRKKNINTPTRKHWYKDVMAFMQAHPHNLMHFAQMYEELKSQGYTASKSSMMNIMCQLARKGALIRVHDGIYKLGNPDLAR